MTGRALVLVADDYDDSAHLLAILLQLERDYDTIAVKDGAEALEVGLDRKPLAALLDIDMPGLKGTEVALRLREQRGHSILLVAITGAGDLASLQRDRVFDLAFLKPLSDVARAEVERQIDERFADQA